MSTMISGTLNEVNPKKFFGRITFSVDLPHKFFGSKIIGHGRLQGSFGPQKARASG
jgi:hypothetical protein